MAKRVFDIVFSALGLVLLSPLLAAAAVAVKLGSPGPVFYMQERVGRNFRPFRIVKFRTMVEGADAKGALITVGGDARITPIGRVLRRYKIDELPQLLNVLRGDMSLVGPRPEVMKYVRLFHSEYHTLLSVKPGITDPAAIRFADEERILAAAGDFEKDYVSRILPEKIKLSQRYAEQQSILLDIKIVLRTIFRIAEPR